MEIHIKAGDDKVDPQLRQFIHELVNKLHRLLHCDNYAKFDRWQ